MRKIFLVAIIVIFIITQASFAASRANLSRIERLFLEGKYDTVVSESDTLIDSGSGNKDELYYLKGLSELKTKRFSSARVSFNQIIVKYRWSKKAFDAHLGLGDSYLLEGDNAKSLDVYNEMVSRYPSDKNIAIVYSRLSSCYAGMGLREKADLYADMAKKKAPLSFEAKSTPVVNPVPKASISSVSFGAGTGGYSVQIGSFKNKKNADKLAQKLAACGYVSYVAVSVSPGDKFYRVKIGKVGSKNEASKLASRLRSEGYGAKICADAICE